MRLTSIAAARPLVALTLGASCAMVGAMVGCPTVHPAPPIVMGRHEPARQASVVADVPSSAPAGTTPSSPTPSSPTPASPTPASPTPASPTPASPTPASPLPSAFASLDAAPSTSVAPPTHEPTSACNEQAPQPFLVRSSYIPVASRKSEHDLAVRYRTERYGYVKGFGQRGWNPTTPDANAVDATFMALDVRVNKRIVPALRCVEVEIKRVCGSPNGRTYMPAVLAGIRYVNTYRGGEVTNHLYGIAIDVDPKRNSCCGCVKPWKDSPICKKKTKSIWERMEMPECWVHAFEKFGFYWLGHDVLQDTMHFEFLGDPDRIVRKP